MSTSNSFFKRWFEVMNPSDVMKDAEVVLEYATEKYIMEPGDEIKQKIIVHGESLGGMSASYVSMKKNLSVDFVFVDRTFSSLDAVAY
jgi:uncharacterized membrane protein